MKIARNSFRKDVVWAFFGQGVTLVFKAVSFILVARFLGVVEFGAFVGAAALVAIFSPFSNLGGGNILLKYVAKDRALFNQYWGNGLILVGVFSFILTVVVLSIACVFFSGVMPFLLVFLVAVSDLFFARILDLVGFAFGSVHRLDKSAWLNILLSLSRLVASLILLGMFETPSATSWAFLYLLSTAGTALVGILAVYRTLGPPKPVISAIKPELMQGFYFSVGLASQNIYNDIDKTLLVRLSSLTANGIYSAAYRIIDTSFIPIRSLLHAAYPRFFQHGLTGIEDSLKFAKRLLLIASTYGIVAMAFLFLTAPLVPFILGEEYLLAVEALRWLSPLIFLKAIHSFLADSLTGAGFQGLRTAIQLGVAGFNVLVCFWLIPVYSWRGAAWASLASDLLLIIGLWGSVMILRTKMRSSQ